MKLYKIGIFILGLACCLSSCKLMRENEVSLQGDYGEAAGQETDENGDLLGEIVRVIPTSLDIEPVVQTFLNTDFNEVEPYSYNETENGISGKYELGTARLIYSASSGENSIIYYDDIDGAGECYQYMILQQYYINEYVSAGLRSYFFEENLDTCSKEEVIEICKPYADVCGYGEADVNVYAMTYECLEEFNNYLGGIMSAPGEGYERLSDEEFSAYMEKVEAGEMSMEEFNEISQLANARGLPWEKKYEALLLCYRPYINGKIVDSYKQCMILVYVPYYERIVYAEAYIPYELEEIANTVPILSQEEAVSKVMNVIGIKSQDDLKIDSISLVYSVYASRTAWAAEDDSTAWTLNPCWRIDYTRVDKPDALGVEQDTKVIDAVDGIVAQYY